MVLRHKLYGKYSKKNYYACDTHYSICNNGVGKTL